MRIVPLKTGAVQKSEQVKVYSNSFEVCQYNLSTKFGPLTSWTLLGLSGFHDITFLTQNEQSDRTTGFASAFSLQPKESETYGPGFWVSIEI